MSVSSCHDGSNHPLIDVLEVYARPHRPETGLARSGASRLSDGCAGMVADTLPSLSSALAVHTVEALSACSRLLGHALGLATAVSPSAEAATTSGGDAPPEPRKTVDDALFQQLGDSALSVLRKTCLASDKSRWRALRASSRSLLAAAQPDAALRAEVVQSAYTAEVTLALVGGSVGGSSGGSGGGEFMEGSTSPELLARVARLCVRVCMKRPELLREGLAPALADAHSRGGDGKLKLAGRFVFPALVRRFWESGVWRRDDRSNTQMVFRCVLQLAVHELRAAGAATAVATTTEEPVEKQAASVSGSLHTAETELLRAGLGELMPLLRSNVARVSQASSTYLTTLLLGPAPAASGMPGSSPASQGVGSLRAEGGGASFPEAGASGETDNGSRANAPSAGASQGAAAGSYAASAESMSEAEGRIETEATSDPGSDSDGDAEGETNVDGGDSGGRGEESSERRVDPVATVQLARGGLKRTTQLRSLLGAGEREGGTDRVNGASARGNPAAPEQPASAIKKSDPVAAPLAAFGDLLSSSRKRARTSPSSDGAFGRGSAPRGGDGAVAGDDQATDQEGSRASAEATARAADQKSGSPAVESSSERGVVRGGATAVMAAATAAATAAAAAVAAATAPATSASTSAAAAAAGATGSDAPGASAASSSKVCYRCDGCDDFPLQHVRHHCLVCADFDLCPQCYDVCHGPNSQFQGGSVMTLGGHSSTHRMEAVQVRTACGWRFCCCCT